MKRLVVIVDCQNDFVDGPLGTKEARQAVPHIVERLEEYMTTNEPTVFIATLDTHDNDYPDTFEGKRLPIDHCRKGTSGINIVPAVNTVLNRIYTDLTKMPADYPYRYAVLSKDTFGTFSLAFPHPRRLLSQITHDSVLESASFDEIILMGFDTDICVVSNALLLRTYYSGVPIKVIENCCAGSTPEKHQAALEVMNSCMIDIV